MIHYWKWDKVRTELPKKSKLEKGKIVYSEEVYTIYKVIPGNKAKFTIPRYKLIDSKGVIQKNTWPISSLLVIPSTYVE